ncbi:MAG TPA: cytochrome D ubiquinol oxidase subunit II, partial [Candidatus Eisenbacteria bacterium]|nr:cytochrome D ubiquinol oxidase subunit II [Candidatus Eisenbacteria bacterium]
ETAAAEVESFYRNYHSQRYVRDSLVLRMRRPLAAEDLAELNARFTDILSGPATQAPGPVPGEGDELPDLPRLVLPFNRSGFSRLRSLIDVVNAPA